MYVLQFSFEFSRFYTLNEFKFFNKFVLSLHLTYTIFPWVFTVLYIQRIQIFKKTHTICTSNVHTFPLNFHYFVLSTKSNFSTSLNYLYILFCTFTIWYVHWFSIDFSQISTFNYFELFYKFKLFKAFTSKWFIRIIHFSFMELVHYSYSYIFKKTQKPFKCNNRTNAKNSFT